MAKTSKLSTPTKSISPPARRTRSAVKKRQSRITQEGHDSQEQTAATPKPSNTENSLRTPSLSTDTAEHEDTNESGVVIVNSSAASATPRITRSSRKKVALPPPPSTPVPPPPPSTKKYLSTRSKVKGSVENLDGVKVTEDDSKKTPRKKQERYGDEVLLSTESELKMETSKLPNGDLSSGLHKKIEHEALTPIKSDVKNGISKIATGSHEAKGKKSPASGKPDCKDRESRKRKDIRPEGLHESKNKEISLAIDSYSQDGKSKKIKGNIAAGHQDSSSKELSSPELSQLKSNKKSAKEILTASKKKVPIVERSKKKKIENKTATPQMKVHVHRFRNANYVPRGILRLCSTPFSPSCNHYPQLAISREGGAVELVSVNEKWKCIASVQGMKNRNVDAMAWLCGIDFGTKPEDQSIIPNAVESKLQSATTYFNKAHKLAAEVQQQRRLFGASRDGTIFEIDFRTRRHKGVIGSGGGAVFCLASLCPCCQDSSSSCDELLAAGCEDGSVRVYRATKSTKVDCDSYPCLELISTLPTVGSAAISLAWIPGSGKNRIQGSIIYVGAADGTIRKFQCFPDFKGDRSSGSGTHSITTGKVLNGHGFDVATQTMKWQAGPRITLECQGNRSSTKVWTVKALSDGTVISGDSLGNVQFWDGNAGTLICSFEHNTNNADVLDLAVSYDECKVMASGIDCKVICIERVSSVSCNESRWVLTSQQRSHTHDVNSLAIVYKSGSPGFVDESSKYLELLCSGGLDTKVCSYFVADMKKHRAKIAYKYPPKAPICLSRAPRILSIMRPDKVDFYQLAKLDAASLNGCNIALNAEQTHIGSVGITSNFNLISFDVSDDGQFLAMSHSAGLMIFHLNVVRRPSDDNDGRTLSAVVPKQVHIPPYLDMACTALKFGPDTLICATASGSINVVQVQKKQEDYELISICSFDQESSVSRNYPVEDLTISANGEWFAAAKTSLGKGSLQVFSLAEKKLWWTLPCTESPQSSIKFLDDQSSLIPVLAVACNNGAFYLFDVEKRCLSDWSEDLSFPAGPNLPKELMNCPNCPQQLLYDRAKPNKLIMGGHSWFCSIDLNSPVPLHSKPFPADHFLARNWRINSRARNDSNSNFTICLRYTGIIFQEFLGKDEMVIVEQPWLSIVSALPDALDRQRYGS